MAYRRLPNIKPTPWAYKYSFVDKFEPFLPRPLANEFVYRLSEIAGHCVGFRGAVVRLRDALTAARSDSWKLWDASEELHIDLVMMQENLSFAHSLALLLADSARHLPPLSKLTDDEFWKRKLNRLRGEVRQVTPGVPPVDLGKSHTPRIDWDRLDRKLEGFLPKSLVGRLSYDLFRLDEGSLKFCPLVEKVKRSLSNAKKDSRKLWSAADNLGFAVSSMRDDACRAESVVSLLHDNSRQLPPLCDLTNRQIGKRDNEIQQAQWVEIQKAKEKKNRKKMKK